MTEIAWGRLVWYVFFVAVIFGGLELAARGILGVAPWPTFSGTVEHDVQQHSWFALVAATVTVGVTVHWLFGQRFFPSLVCAFSWALSAHLLDNRWP